MVKKLLIKGVDKDLEPSKSFGQFIFYDGKMAQEVLDFCRKKVNYITGFKNVVIEYGENYFWLKSDIYNAYNNSKDIS